MKSNDARTTTLILAALMAGSVMAAAPAADPVRVSAASPVQVTTPRTTQGFFNMRRSRSRPGGAVRIILSRTGHGGRAAIPGVPAQGGWSNQIQSHDPIRTRIFWPSNAGGRLEQSRRNRPLRSRLRFLTGNGTVDVNRPPAGCLRIGGGKADLPRAYHDGDRRGLQGSDFATGARRAS